MTIGENQAASFREGGQLSAAHSDEGSEGGMLTMDSLTAEECVGMTAYVQSPEGKQDGLSRSRNTTNDRHILRHFLRLFCWKARRVTQNIGCSLGNSIQR